MSLKKVTTNDIIEKKKKGEKIVTITSYDYSFAKIVDESGVDLVLVGDSLSIISFVVTFFKDICSNNCFHFKNFMVI